MEQPRCLDIPQKGAIGMTIEKVCQEIRELGFHVSFKKIDHQAVILIGLQSASGNHVKPFAHFNQNQTDYFIHYNNTWKSLDFESQKQLVYLMKTFSIYK